jgi:hypothetical protein
MELFIISFLSIHQELASIDIISSISSDPDLSSIPPEYHEFINLFSEAEADKLSPYHPYDHIIPLEPGTTPSFDSIYSISPAELEIL